MTALIGFLLLVLFVVLIVWAIQYLTKSFQTPQPIVAVIYVVLVIIVVYILVNQLGLSKYFP